jgi:hypothetical protein
MSQCAIKIAGLGVWNISKVNRRPAGEQNSLEQLLVLWTSCIKAL